MFFDTGFPDQILRFDRACEAVYGRIRHGQIRHRSEADGRPIAVEDATIAATAGLTTWKRSPPATPRTS
jgi:predicted nucleic acid-binding protein